MISDYIPDDGYTENGYIAAVPRIHNTIRFKFRPMLTGTRAKLFAGSDKLAAENYEAKSADEISKHLVEWDLKDSKGEPLPIKPAILLRIKPMALSKLTAIVCGTSPGDPDPDATEEKRVDESQQLYEALMNGESVGQHREAVDSKN